MIASTADRRSRRRERVVTAFRARFHRAPEIVVDAPGRIALLGAHIDDSEGFALPIAIDRGIALAAARAPGRQSTWRALDLDDEVALDPEALPAPLPERGGAARWSDLPAGVLRALRSAGGRAAQPPALEVVFGGDLPSGVGLSSSAAVSVACLLAWREAAAIDLERGDLVHLARRAERKQLGVAVGVLDPAASLFGRVGHALYLDCRDLSREPLPLPPTARLLVIDSGVTRSLANSEFSRRRSQVARALRQVRTALKARGEEPPRTLRDLDSDQLASTLPQLDALPARRARHVVEECRRVLDGAEALRRGDLAELGSLMIASHASSRDLFEVSIPALDRLADASMASGAVGARLLGGGFGGAVLTLCVGDPTPVIDELGRRLPSLPPHAILEVGAADGACVHAGEAARSFD